VEAEDYATDTIKSCDGGKLAQYQSSYCDTDSDGNAFVVMAVYADDSCSGDPLIQTSFDGVDQLASLGVCTPGTASVDGTMGQCLGDKLVDFFYGTSDCSGPPVFNITQTKCEMFCVSPQTSGAGTCFAQDGTEIDGCVCDSSCGTCGFSSDEAYEYGVIIGDGTPDSPFDCQECKDGLNKLVLFDDETGLCMPPPVTQCFATPGGEPLADCTCDPSCGSCGYGAAPTGASDCISCQPDTPILENVSEGGAGDCRGLEMVVVFDSDGDVEVWLMSTSRSTVAKVGVGILGVVAVAGVVASVGLYTGERLGTAQRRKMEHAALTVGTKPQCYGTAPLVVESQPLV